VAQAQRYVTEGYNYMVDIGLEKFFGRVNHDRLIARVAARVPGGVGGRHREAPPYPDQSQIASFRPTDPVFLAMPITSKSSERSQAKWLWSSSRTTK
jgi:hypothetical protein